MFSVRRPAARSRLRDTRIPQRLHYQSFSMLILLLLSHTRYGRPMLPPRLLAALLCFCLLGLSGCNKDELIKAGPSQARLLQREKPTTREEVFGLILPPWIKIRQVFKKRAWLETHYTPEKTANYIRKHISASRVETSAAGTIFPSAIILRDTKRRPFRISIRRRSTKYTEIRLRDLSRIPGPPMTEKEAFKAAGMDENGVRIDEATLQ